MMTPWAFLDHIALAIILALVTVLALAIFLIIALTLTLIEAPILSDLYSIIYLQHQAYIV